MSERIFIIITVVLLLPLSQSALYKLFVLSVISIPNMRYAPTMYRGILCTLYNAHFEMGKKRRRDQGIILHRWFKRKLNIEVVMWL